MTTPRAIPAAEIPRILAECAPGRDRTAVRMSLATGLRVHELLALNVGDLLYPDGTVRESIRLRVWKDQGDATEDPRQVVYLSAALRAELADYIATLDPGEPLFPAHSTAVPYGTPLERHRLGYILRAACQRAGVGPYRWHDLRHTFITGLAERGVEAFVVQALARHKSILTTMIYMHVSPGRLTEAVEGL